MGEGAWRPIGDMDTWWWNDEVKDAIKIKNGQEEVGNIRKAERDI